MTLQNTYERTRIFHTHARIHTLVHCTHHA